MSVKPSPDPGKIRAAARKATVRIEVAQCGSIFPSGSGSGVLINDHQILTAAHVVDNAAAISVQRSDDAGAGTHAVSAATVVGRDDKADLALIELTGDHTMGSDRTALRLAKTAAAVDDPIVLIGYPEGGPRRSISGTVTNLNQSPQLQIAKNETKDLEGVMQLNADLQPGDSGGPVINGIGRVVGINEAADATSDISYAVPAAVAAPLLNQGVPWPEVPAYHGLDCRESREELTGNLSAHADSLMIWRRLRLYLVGVSLGNGPIPSELQKLGVTGWDNGFAWAWSMLADPYKVSFGNFEGFRNYWADITIGSPPVVIKGSMEAVGYGHDVFDASWYQVGRNATGDCDNMSVHLNARNDRTGTWQITDVDVKDTSVCDNR